MAKRQNASPYVFSTCVVLCLQRYLHNFWIFVVFVVGLSFGSCRGTAVLQEAQRRIGAHKVITLETML